MSMRVRIAAVTVAVSLCASSTPAQAPFVFTKGDVFVSIGGGVVRVYREVLPGQYQPVFGLSTGQFAFRTTGSAFDKDGNFYVTTFTDTVNNGSVFRFPRNFDPFTQLATELPTGGSAPESIVIDAAGNLYVGHGRLPDDKVRKLAPDGTLLDIYDNMQVEGLARAGDAGAPQGTDWLDLASDQHTLFYTSQGRTIFRYDTATHQQLPPFADLTNEDIGTGQLFALRLLPDGGLLVADNVDIKRLDSSGHIVQRYDIPVDPANNVPAYDNWFSLNLDPDGQSFWSGDGQNGRLHRFAIDTGQVLASLDTGYPASFFGVSVFEEVTQGSQAPAQCTPVIVTVPAVEGATCGVVTAQATLTCGGQPVADRSVAFTINGSDVGSASTDTAGLATIGSIPAPATPGSFPGGVTASFAGDEAFAAATGTADLVLQNGCVPALTLSKIATPETYRKPGDAITYSYELRNTGHVTLTAPFNVTDDKLGTFACSTTPALAPGDPPVTCQASHQITADEVGTVPALPTNVPALINTGDWLRGRLSTQDTLVRAAGIPSDVYPGWCIQDHVAIDLHGEPATLFSSIGAGLPEDVAHLPWGSINYVLNHKLRRAGASDLEFFEDVQTAIWVLLGEPNPSFGVSATAAQMIAAGRAHADFVPGPQDVVAVIVYSDGMGTYPYSIQESIVEMKPAQAITNHAFGTALAGGDIVQSNEAAATVRQVFDGPPSAPLAIHPPVESTTVISSKGRGTRTTRRFSTTAPGQLLLAFVSSDGPARGRQSTRVAGGRLHWTLVQRANHEAGTAEVWQAYATNPGTLAVTSTQKHDGYDQHLTVIVFDAGARVGTSAAAGARHGAPTLRLRTTDEGSLLYGVGHDWDRAVGRRLYQNQVMVRQWIDRTVHDTFWLQALAEPAGPVGTAVKIGAHAPTHDRWNLAAVEVVR